MKRFVLFVLLFLTFPVAAGLSEALFMPEDSEIIEIADLYIRAGKILPADSFPVSIKTVAEWAETLSEDELPDALKSEAAAFLKMITAAGESVAAEIDWQAGYEYYYRDTAESLYTISDYLTELPFMKIGSSVTDFENGGASLELQIKREYSDNPSDNFLIGENEHTAAMEYQIVSEGYIYFNNDFIQLIIGRVPSHYGNERFSSLMANRNLPFLDQIKLDMQMDGFRLEYYLASLENRLCAEDVDVTGTGFSSGKNSIWTTMHRVGYSFDSVRISLAEQTFISRTDNQLYLGDFFPLTVWHNTWLSGGINISAFTDIDWTVFPGFELYFQAGFDDINVDGVLGMSDSSIPTINAFILGLAYAGAVSKSVYSLQIETGYTHYLWGNFSKSGPFQKAIYRVFLEDGNKMIPFSSPYGPGALWIKFDSGITFEYGLSCGLSASFVSKNTEADLISTLYKASDESMAAALRKIELKSGLNINMNLFKRFDLYLKPSFIYTADSISGAACSNASTGYELTLGGKVSGRERISRLKE